MTIDVYYMSLSPPCRAVMMAANALGVKINLKFLDLFKGEHMTPEFLKLNPQHCVPTMVDDGFVLTQGRAIMCYLADQYGKDDSLYPKDPKKRALVNHMLYFEASDFYPKFIDYYVPILYFGGESDPIKLKKLEDAFALLEKFLDGKTWVTGDHITLADLSLVAAITSIEIFEFDITQFPNVSRWLANAKKTIPKYDELNHAGVLEHRKAMDANIVLKL